MEVTEQPIETQEPPASISYSSRDELNLAEFPIALLTERAPSGQKTLEFQDEIYDQKQKQVVCRKLTITGSDKFGLPTSKDDEVILGLIHITKHVNGFSDRRVRFQRSDLIKLLRWPDTGQSYRRISKSLACWLGVTLYYENSWWDKQSGSWITKGFHIIDGFEIADGVAHGDNRQLSLLSCEFTWNEVIFRSFQSGYLKSLDFDIYLEFKYPTTQRMYRFLDKHFFRKSRLEYDLKTFACEHIGLSRKYFAAKIKEKIQPAIEELESIGFIETMTREERYEQKSRGEWTIRFARKPTAKTLEPQEAGGERADAKKLVTRGVTAATAHELVAAYPAELIAAQVEVFDWLLAKKDKRIAKSPAGYLVKAIQDNYAAPAGFESKAVRGKRKAAEQERSRRAEEGRKRTEAEERAREDAEQARIKTYWDSLSEADQESLRAEALSQANPFYAQLYRRSRNDPASAERHLKLILRNHIAALLDSQVADEPPEGPRRPA